MDICQSLKQSQQVDIESVNGKFTETYTIYGGICQAQCNSAKKIVESLSDKGSFTQTFKEVLNKIGGELNSIRLVWGKFTSDYKNHVKNERNGNVLLSYQSMRSVEESRERLFELLSRKVDDIFNGIKNNVEDLEVKNQLSEIQEQLGKSKRSFQISTVECIGSLFESGALAAESDAAPAFGGAIKQGGAKCLRKVKNVRFTEEAFVKNFNDQDSPDKVSSQPLIKKSVT